MKPSKTSKGVIEKTLSSKITDEAELSDDERKFLSVSLERYKGKMKKLSHKLDRKQN